MKIEDITRPPVAVPFKEVTLTLDWKEYATIVAAIGRLNAAGACKALDDTFVLKGFQVDYWTRDEYQAFFSALADVIRNNQRDR